MNQNTNRFEAAVETFENSSDMSRAEAEVYVERALAGHSRQKTADRLDKSPNTVDAQFQSAKKKARLPEVTKLEPRASHAGDDVFNIWFANDARLRYKMREHEDGGITIYEETFAADDPHSVVQSFELPVGADEFRDAAVESLAEYINEYRTDPEACRKDWPHVFEAITLYDA